MEKAALEGGFFMFRCSGNLQAAVTPEPMKAMLVQTAPKVKATMFDYSDRDNGWLRECLSAERLKPYLMRARGDEWVAFHLYVRNMEISSSLYGVLHVLEVGLRNRIHTKMAGDLKSEEWWDVLPLLDAELEDIAKAKRQISQRVQQAYPGRIVAELNFGFWVKLFSKGYEKALWVPHLTYRFPAKISRKMLHDRLLAIKEIRNRIAHHETLISRNHKEDYDSMLETIGWISPTLRRWAEHHSDFLQVLERRIPKRPRGPEAGSAEGVAGGGESA